MQSADGENSKLQQLRLDRRLDRMTLNIDITDDSRSRNRNGTTLSESKIK